MTFKGKKGKKRIDMTLSLLLLLNLINTSMKKKHTHTIYRDGDNHDQAIVIENRQTPSPPNHLLSHL
jgi:hypothetical protein